MKKVLALILAAMMSLSVLSGCTTLEPDDKGAIIDMYLTTEVYNFDPQNAITDDAMLKVMSLLFEGLTTIDENGKWKKALMKSYKEVKNTDEPYSIQITLNDTRWSDGRTVQATDIVYAWKRLLDPDNKCEAASLLYDIKNAYDIKNGDNSVDDLGVTAVDTYVIQIDFVDKIDINQFFENCSSLALVPLREDVITKYSDLFADAWASKATYIISNGPFTLKDCGTSGVLKLERNAYYYIDQEKEEPVLDQYVIPYRLLTEYTGDAAALLEKYNAGTIYYNGEIPMSARANTSAEVTDMMATMSYVFNENNAIFAKAEVRTALSMALDRNTIAGIVGYAKPATGYVPYKVFDTKTGTSFREVGGNLISTTGDVSGAKSLLGSAGVSGGSFAITVRNNEVDLAVAEYAKGVWEQLGFSVTVNAVKPGTTVDIEGAYVDKFETLYETGDFDVIGIDSTMLSPDAFSALSQFAPSYSGNGVNMYSDDYEVYTHVSGYNSEAYTEIIDRAYAEKDRAARAAILHEAEQKLIADMPICPLVFLQDAYVASGELSGIKSTYYGTKDFNKTKLNDYYAKKLATDTSAAAQ